MVHANHVRTRIALVHVDENDEFVPADINTKLAQEAIWSMQNHELIHFTMCNPPFYTSQQEMLSLARIKKTPANAVCHGTSSEMVTAGGELRFVQRMIQQSLSDPRVVWWTCMLGKLSSVVQVAQELEPLSNERRIRAWGVHELPTGGGRTRRWVLLWTTKSGLRIPPSWSRATLPSSLKRHAPASGERSGKVIKRGVAWTRKELFELTMHVLDGLEGCSTYASAYQRFDSTHRLSCETDKQAALGPKANMTSDTGTIDVILTKQSWSRKARRAKLQVSEASTRYEATKVHSEPLLMARISVGERTATNEQGAPETGLVMTVSWTYGIDAVKFESFATFLLAAVEKRVEDAVRTQAQ